MITSPAGRSALAMREGRRLKAYKDSVGVWTIGIGHTSAAGPPTVTSSLVITDKQCDEIFARDLLKYEATVNTAVKRPLTQNQFDACVSLCYNIGQSAFAASTVVKKINAGDMAGAAQAFMMWNKPSEILGRRRGEMQQFMRADTGVQPPDVTPHHPSPMPPAVTPIHLGIAGLFGLAITAVVAGWQHIVAFFSHLF